MFKALTTPHIRVLCLVLLALLPTALLRDLNPVDEFKYLSIAADALERGNFFAFYLAGEPYADKPPLYLWLCMLSYALTTYHGAILLILGSVLPFVVLLYLLDKFWGVGLDERQRSGQILTICAMLLTCGLAIVARMDMLFTLLIGASFIVLLKRTQLILSAPQQNNSAYLNALGLLIFGGIFVKGPYALFFPLVALIFILYWRGALKAYFKIVRPRIFLIIILGLLLWGVAVYLDDGSAYLKDLFITQSAQRLSGKMGHPKPIYWYLTNIWYLALPFALSFIYLLIKDLKAHNFKHDLLLSGSVSMVLAVILVISLPSSKLEIYLLPALPFMALYVCRSVSLWHGKVPLSFRLVQVINCLPYVLVLPAVIYLAARRYTCVQHPGIYLAAACLSLSALSAIIMTLRVHLQAGFATVGVGVLSFILCLGFAMESNINPIIGIHDIALKAIATMDKGGTHKACTVGIAYAENFVLFDKRFEMLINTPPTDERCTDAMLLLGNSALRHHPEYRELAMKRGGVEVGDKIFAPAPVAAKP